MAKLDMRKALAGAVAPLESNTPSRESARDLHLVETVPVTVSAPEPDDVDETARSVDVADSPATDEKEGRPPRKSTPRRKAAPIGPATTSELDATPLVTAMGFDVEQPLDARLVAYRASTRLSYHQIVLDAVEHSYPQLAELVARALGRTETAQPQVKLFERTFVPAPVALEGKTERVTHTIRITTSNREMLDSVAEETQSPSRNFMICVALDNYLPA